MKYNINKDFKALRHIRAPLNSITIRLAKLFLPMLPKKMKSNRQLKIEKVKIPTSDNNTIKAYIIKPQNADNTLPVIFYYHGGAFVFGGAPYHYAYAKKYALSTNSVVVFANYRLSYNSPFGTPLNDCIDTYKYITQNANEFGIDTDKIVVAGDSAGGYLSIMTAITANRQQLATPKLQMLIYPVIDPRCNTKSMQEYTSTPIWNAKLNKKMWKLYAKNNTIQSPLEFADLVNMPTTYIETAQYDCLHDEAVEFYTQLHNLGINCTLFETQNTVHGYDMVFKSPITKNSLDKRIEFLNKINK